MQDKDQGSMGGSEKRVSGLAAVVRAALVRSRAQPHLHHITDSKAPEQHSINFSSRYGQVLRTWRAALVLNISSILNVVQHAAKAQ